MTISNNYTTFISTILKRYGIQIVSFNDDSFDLINYNYARIEKFPILHKPTEEELDKIVESLNECPITCVPSSDDIPNEDNC